jgi:hypothetical protein
MKLSAEALEFRSGWYLSTLFVQAGTLFLIFGRDAPFVAGRSGVILAALEPTILVTTADFLNYRICAGYAWLARHQPAHVPPDTDPGNRRRTAADADVRLLARDVFPGGIAIEQDDPEAGAEATVRAMLEGAQTLYGATVVTGRGVAGVADVLARSGDSWVYHLARASTSIKSEHVIEAAYGARVFAEAGIEISAVRLVLLRKQYRRDLFLDIGQLLISEDISARVTKVASGVARDLDAALAILGDRSKPAACRCELGTRGQRCPTFSYFHPSIGSGATVYDLGGVSGRKLDEVLARGIVWLEDWPDDVDVTPRQRRQIEVTRHGEPFIDVPRLEAFLGRLTYPLHFLDYETFQTAVPLFDGCLPWSQIPFQYSIHVVDDNGEMTHREFLWTDRERIPVPSLVARMREDIGETGSVVVWNQGFEQSRNREMAEMLPESAGFLHGLNARMVDLMEIVKDGIWVHPDFNGSASIKKVLPVAAPALSYDLLDISDGMTAAERWVQAVLREPEALAEVERNRVFDALREYCQRDTLAMVRVLDHLRHIVEGSGVAPVSR